MRKLYLFFAVLCSLLGAQTATAYNFEARKTYYLNLNGYWDDANATERFAAYFYVSDTNNEWCDLEKVYGESQIYKVTPSGSWNNVIFVRMNGNTSANDWSNKWNQTGNITSRSGNMYVLSGWESGNWSDTDFCYYLVGKFNSWTKDDASKLTDNGSGVFTSENISFESAGSGDAGLKVVSSLSMWYGASSFTFSETATSTAGLSAKLYTNSSNIPYDLSSEYSVEFTLGSDYHTLAFTKLEEEVTETGRELKKVAFMQGSNELASDSSSPYEFSNISVTTGAEYRIAATYTVTYSDNSTTTDTVYYYTSSSPTLGTEATLTTTYSNGAFTFSSAGTVNATVTVSNNVPTAVTFTDASTADPDDPVDTDAYNVYKIVLMRGDGNGNYGNTQVAEFTQDSENPWLWTLGPQEVNKNDDKSTDEKYRYRVYITESKYVDYSTDASNNDSYVGESYSGGLFVANGNASFCMNLTTAYFAVTLYDGVLYTTKISGSAISASDMTDPTPDPETDETSELVNMPLKERDFADGKAHYFVVGTRMSEWRLQPEWELTDEDGDGTYTLANRLLYNGMMGIAKVDDYNDYIHQRYTFYSVAQTISGDATLTLTTNVNPNASQLTVTCAESTNKFTAINYGKDYTKGQFTSSNTIIWGGTGENNILTSTPTYVGTISVADADNGGLTLTLSDSSTDASVIAQYRTFSLVGSAIYNTEFNTEETCATPLRNDGEGTTAWQEAWIQFDGYGKPYYDAYGNLLYQTVFQREWLANHPTIFKADDGFEYNSLNIVFNYDASQTHSATIPADGEAGWATNNGSTTSPNTSYTVTNNDGWQCFVVENMWLGGQFKVWTGWGGADKTQDGSGSGTTDARWYYANGGHHTENTDWTISAYKPIYYGTAQDKNGADFSLGDDRIFARYVKVWWNPSAGFDGSFLQLITEEGGPQISCARDGDDAHTLQYTWSVPTDQLAQNYDVKNIKIVRYRLDSDGNETSIVISDTSYAEGDLKGSDVNEKAATDQVDSNPAEGGYYWYKIEIEYYGNESAEEKSAFTRDAESNRVYIYYETIPNGATVKQLAYTTATAETRADESVDVTAKYWSFDLAVNASAPESLIGKKLESDSSKDLLTLVEYYVVGVPNNAAGATYTSASVNGETVTAHTADELNTLSVSSENATEFNTTGYTYFKVAPDADNYYAMPELILHNVIPDSYYAASSMNFTIDMVSSNGDDAEWSALNISTAKPEVSMYVPTACYDVTTFAISKADDTEAVATDETNQPLGTSEAQPVSFHSFNKLGTTDGKIAQLMVTDGVLTNWTVNYTLSAAVGTTTFSATPQYENAAVNDAAGVTVNFDYLPVAYTSDNTGNFGTSIAAIDDLTFRQMNAQDLTVTTNVKYTRTTGNVETTALPAEFKKSINPTVEGNVTGYDQLVAYNGTSDDDKSALKKFTVHNKGAWSSTTSDGEVIYFLDAYKAIELKNETTLNKAVGYYSSNGHSCTTKYYGETATAGYQEIPVLAGGEVITSGDGYDEPFNALINAGYSEDDNFAEKAASEGILPIKIGHIGEGNATGENLTYSDVYTVLTAEYPFLVKPQYVTPVSTASDESTETAALVTLAYPSLVKATSSDATTEIDNVTIAAGDFRIYPNPAVDVVNVAASAALGRVEIYSVDGRLVKVVEVDDTHAAIEVGDLVKGSYIIRAAGSTQRMIKK